MTSLMEKSLKLLLTKYLLPFADCTIILAELPIVYVHITLINVYKWVLTDWTH